MIQNADKIKNIYEMFEYSVKKYSTKKCLGVRPILGESKTNVNGKIEEKLKLRNEYVWNTFKEIEERVINISNGLSVNTTLEERNNVIIYADTCSEWLITALACFRNNYKIATLYTNLGSDGIR